MAVHLGTSGVGVDLAAPVSQHFGVRVGGDFIRYTGSFQEDAATIDAFLQFGYARAALDWFPFKGSLHVSPLLVLADNTRVQANVHIDPSQQFDLSGEQFRGSATDPLQGVGRVELRHTAPGLTIGTGNLTRGKGHFVFPFEVGFFYVAQPKLTVDFSGSVCDVTHPEVGCRRVEDNPDFQQGLDSFIARNNHNLSYAQFIPILNFGVGYRF